MSDVASDALAPWRSARVEDVALRVTKGTTPTTVGGRFANQGVNFVKVEAITDAGRIEMRKLAHIDEESNQLLSRSILAEDDVLFTIAGTIGRVARVERNVLPANTNQAVAIVRPNPAAIDSRFLFYALRDKARLRLALSRVVQSVQANFSLAELGALEIALPPLNEQRAIAAILGALDDKIELNRQTTHLLDDLYHVVYREWFQGESSEGWPLVPLSQLCETQYGYTASANAVAVGPKLLRVKDINKVNWIDWNTVPFCECDESERARYALNVGDVVVARMADPGKAAIVEDDVDAVFASYLVRLKTESLALAHFVYGFLKSPLYDRYAEGATSGSVQRNMNARVIVGTEVAVPPKERMKEFYEIAWPLRQKIAYVLRESATLTTLRDALLPRLISGELRGRDAEALAEAAT